MLDMDALAVWLFLALVERLRKRSFQLIFILDRTMSPWS